DLLSLEPFRGSCDCADFLRGSLGICKHLLVVLGHVVTSERRIAAARRELAAPPPSRLPVLRWDPVRPFRGDGDRLLGLRLMPAGANGAGRGRGHAAPHRTDLDGWLVDGRPAPSTLVSVSRRRDLLQRLVDAHARRRLAMEPGARALVVEELARAERRSDAIAAAPALLAQLKTLKRKLYPYQREGVRRVLEARRLLLADDMGLGKTTQAIAICHALFRAEEVTRGLVVVPASLKDQWLREWTATTDTPAAILEGRAEERRATLRRTRRGFLVMSYEQLLRDLAAVHRFAPEVVVIDEAQRIKNWATKSSLSVKTLSPEWRLVLTGTPMENRLEELASLLDWVDDVALTPKWRLVPWHTTFAGDGARGRTGARNLDTLRERLAPCVVRRVRQEVIAQLPPRTDTRVPVPMTEQQRAEHDELIVPIASLVHRAQQRPLTQAEFLRLMSLLTTQRIISNGLGQLHFDDVWPSLADRAASDAALEGLFAPKLGELRRLIEELVVTQGRKVVVFSQWRAMLRLAEWAIRDVLADAGLGAAFFTGAESQRLRTRNVVDFHDDPRCAVLLLSDAGGVGLNLQRAASACINLELPWNPAVLEQRVGRIYRL
ncbi:MAG TPA: DEAD/DEAH box helicase, partial [Polyangiaceae bacterium]|nr:DEAD/DEAH box helicase [Polyangiaceae bacterium]